MEFETFWEQADEEINSNTKTSNTESCKPLVANDNEEKPPTSNMPEVLNHQITLEKRTC